jgi:hypothetical protein
MFMEGLGTSLRAIFCFDFQTEILGPLKRLWFQRFHDGCGQFVGRQSLVGDWFRPGPSPGGHRTPKRLVTEERHNNSWSPGQDASGSRSRATVMHHARNMFEEPIVRTIAQHEDSFRDA